MHHEDLNIASSDSDRGVDDELPDENAPDENAPDEGASGEGASGEGASDTSASDTSASDTSASDTSASDKSAPAEDAPDERALDDRGTPNEKAAPDDGRGAVERNARGARGARSRVPKRPLGDVAPVPSTGRITALLERRAGSTRYVVEVDGTQVATVSTELIAALGLRVGRAMDAGLAARLREAAGALEVFDKAIAFLAIRARSARDLQLRLRRAGALPPTIAEVIDRLRALDLLNDEAYARNVARSRALSGGVSKRRIAQELQRRGVARDVADAAVADTLADVGLDESEAAMSVALKRMRALRSLDVRKQRQRLYAFLARRGYDSAIIAKVVATVVAGAADGSRDEASDEASDESSDESSDEASDET